MKTAATETRTKPARLVTTALLACTIALLAWSATAQTPDVTEAEMRDLRAQARTGDTTAPMTGFTQAELRDLRAEARIVFPTSAGPVHAFTERELHDLRSQAHAHRIAVEADIRSQTDALGQTR